MVPKDNNQWELIEGLLAAEASGKSPRLFSSRRTLFGIPSALDEELAKVAAEGSGGSGNLADATVSKVQRVVHPLAPVFDDQSQVLILGTMPSPRSRETGFYYNHPQNRFWPVMGRLFNEATPQTNEEKRSLILRHHLALWDVLAECTIEGAADGTIAECIPNDIAVLTAKAPIQAIFCTGAKAAELYGRYCEQSTGMACVKLPSTSSANAKASLEDLVEAYRLLLDYL